MSGASGDWLRPIDWDILRAKCFTPVQGRVLFALWSRCDAAGFCRPSIKMIAEDCGCDQRSARAAVEWLAEMQVMMVEIHNGTPHGYHLDPDHILAFARSHKTTIKSARASSDKSVPPTKMRSDKSVGATSDIFVVEPLTKVSDKEEPREEEPVRRAIPSPSPSFPLVTSETTTAARPVPKRVRKEKLPEPPLEDVIAFLIAEHADIWGESEVRRRVDKALNHKSSDKWKNKAEGLKGWLGDDAAKIRAARGTSPPQRNGTGPPAKAGPLSDTTVDLSYKPRGRPS